MSRLFRFIVLFLSPISAFSSSPQYAGTYEDLHPFVGTTLEIREDGTLNYEIFFDVGGAQSSEGTWEEIKPGLIVTNTIEKKPESVIETEALTDGAGFEVHAIDALLELPLQETKVTFWCPEGEFVLSTNETGQVSVPNCNPYSIWFDKRGYYPVDIDLEDASPTKITAYMTMQMVVPYLSNQLWYLHDDKLYQLEYSLDRAPGLK